MASTILLSWLLAGIDCVESLRDTLVFKGGTALKKCYFGDYRFSEDLDFSGVGDVPTGEAMEWAVRAACDAATQLLDALEDDLPRQIGEVIAVRRTSRLACGR